MGRFKSLRFDFYVFNFDTMKVILFGKSAEKPYGKLLLTKRNGTHVSYQYLRSDLAKDYNFDRRRWLWGAAPKMVGCISADSGVHLLFCGVQILAVMWSIPP